ncbi:MAG TPA: DNA-deoxyinosine glycosylase [Steroidobacteraceae bacterium]|nr:DNA-deoxyinosine glycosylase [Steroidobacteraceae bacterium]
MSRARSFAAVVGGGARLLILGSMPGAASLAARQYYAHPYNRFWSILGEICGAGGELPYPRRLHCLKSHGFALWDVLHSCVRVGSLDSSIERRSARPNDIPGLLRRHPGIVRICCNGATAHAALLRYFGPELRALGVEVRRLPSTSPANAGCPPADKLAAWRAALTSPVAPAAKLPRALFRLGRPEPGS